MKENNNTIFNNFELEIKLTLNSIHSANFISCEQKIRTIPVSPEKLNVFQWRIQNTVCSPFLLSSSECVHQPKTHKKPFIRGVRLGQLCLGRCTVREARKENIFLSMREISHVPWGYWPFSLVCFQTVTRGLLGQTGRKCGISQIDYEHGKFCSSA